jgi:hypothetical protein
MTRPGLGLACLLLRLYPRAWRARYGDELLALIEDQPWSIGAALDLFLGAVEERVRQLTGWRPQEITRLALSGLADVLVLEAVALVLALIAVIAAPHLSPILVTAMSRPGLAFFFAWMPLLVAIRWMLPGFMARVGLAASSTVVRPPELVGWFAIAFIGDFVWAIVISHTHPVGALGAYWWQIVMRNNGVQMLGIGTERGMVRGERVQAYYAARRKARRESRQPS